MRDRLIAVLVGLALIVSTGSIFYYFVIFRPKMDKLKFAFPPSAFTIPSPKSGGKVLTLEEAEKKLREKNLPKENMTKSEALKYCSTTMIQNLGSQKVWSISQEKFIEKPGIDLSRLKKEDIDWLIDLCMKQQGFE